jgi:CHAP domain
VPAGGRPSRCSSYDAGECTRGVCDISSWVLDGWGNAKDWLAKAAAAGFQTTMIPTINSVVVYGAGNGYSPLGHVATVDRMFNREDVFGVREMNYTAWNAYDERNSTLQDVIGFILPPGYTPGAGLGPVVLPTATVTALELAWSSVQQLWGQEIDAVISEQTRIVAALAALTGQ